MDEWIHAPIEEQEEFDETVAELCALHRDGEALKKNGVMVYSLDEKTGIQALEREITKMRTGRPERQDHSYKRQRQHGY